MTARLRTSVGRTSLCLALLLAATLALSACDASGASKQASQPSQPATSSAPSAQQATDSKTAQEEPVLTITANGTTFDASFEDNSSAKAFAELLKGGPLTLSLHDYGNFEKVGPLGTSLPTNDEQITTQPGDVILYQGNQITVYYDTNTWSFTRLAHIDGATREDLLAAFGQGDVDVTFSLR